MKSFCSAIVLAMAVLVASTAFAQSRGSGRISGKVVDEAGQPVSDVIIKAKKVGETEIFDGKTNNKGDYAIARVAEGDWLLEFSKVGLATETVKHTVSESDRGTPLNLTMKKPAAPAPPADPMVAINQELKRAAAMVQAGNGAGAREIYEALMAKHPQVYQFPFFIATTHAAEKNYPKALEYTKLATEKEPNAIEVKMLTAEIMMEAGQKEEAKAILDAIDLKVVKDPFPFINLAITLINDQKAPEAIDLLTRLLVQFPDQHSIYYYRGRANLAATKLDEAKADLEKFVSVAPADSKEVADAKDLIAKLAKK